MIRLNNDWFFTDTWSTDFLKGNGAAEAVRLPHTVKELPLHYADPLDYQMISGYRRTVTLPQDLGGKRVFLQLDGAAHIATVYLNGQEIAAHRCGYTAFRTELTKAARPGENLLCVKLDSTENPAVPPFGHVIDYLTYGGLYRDAWLDIRPEQYIEDLFVTTPDLTTAKVQITLSGKGAADHMRLWLYREGETSPAATVSAPISETHVTLSVPDAQPWTQDSPVLYRCKAELLDRDCSVTDSSEVLFGFRTVEFRNEGFYLNGKKTFLRGLNRHQCWPYLGYAVPEKLQREDARILKHELACTAVRTSHYPQSQYFLDECDRQGLLVFTEIPGWQHIGDENWKEQACENTREMVLQYRNHPSIVLWGVRINESQDDDDFYRKTNAIAHELDPSRPTSGVRYLEKSSLLEDVYAFNDFSHTGGNAGCKPKSDVLKEGDHPLLISEHSGHMFPTKPFDEWSHRQEHALRHGRVLNAAMADGQHAGCFGWCMFDYATHKDFGSGDRICYHGVMDSFRNPKPAAALYASQGEETPVLEISSPMDIGDYPGGQIGMVCAFTNADEVALYKNGQFVTNLTPGPLTALPHGPMLMDDTIGCLLETQEGFPKAKADVLRKALIAAGKHGIAGMTLKDKLLFAYCMARHKMTFADGMALYGKYVGNWGGESTVWRFDAVKNGKVVTSATRSPVTALHLECTPSHTDLHDGDSYDLAAVRIRVLDSLNNAAPYAQLPVTLTLEGPAELVGPSVVTAEGGSCGTYIRTCGKAGKAVLTVSTPQTEPVRIEFAIEA